MAAPDIVPTIFTDDVASAARALEVPAADFGNGVNLAGSCSPGIGINMLKGAVVGTPNQFTLLMQDGVTARTPQIGQSIGGLPYVDRDNVPWPGSGGLPGTEPDGSIRYGTNVTNTAKQAAVDAGDPSVDGTVTPIANSWLSTLNAGWVAAV